ncbi:hypothetical protein PG997_000324 [Apiospora hydei]|uniref:Uncharacterized protein n=1 Tax=Apiospora hydei TaxID=1337664 RepID=A0ABR1XAE7_9PEZI
MWNSFGSSGSMSPYTQPLDIPYSSASSRSSAYQPNCAFPSWPQGSSLGSSSSRPVYERATSYLSDDDLFWQDSENDDAHSVSSAASHGSCYAPQQPTEEELQEQRLEEQRKRAQMQRDALRFVKLEKERRRLAAQQQKPRRSNSNTSNPSKKSSNMASIREAAE